MDEMNIVSSFMTKTLSKVIAKIIRKKLGINVDLQIREVKIRVTDGKAHAHIDADADLSKESLMAILKQTGLN